MTRIVLDRRVSNDGFLQLNIPLGTAEAGREVRVTVESVAPNKTMTADEWRSGILATSGGWQGEFEPPQIGELEEREPLSRTICSTPTRSWTICVEDKNQP